MKIREIITNPPRDEYIDQYESELAASGLVPELLLKHILTFKEL